MPLPTNPYPSLQPGLIDPVFENNDPNKPNVVAVAIILMVPGMCIWGGIGYGIWRFFHPH